jgi:hypothetical protein
MAHVAELVEKLTRGGSSHESILAQAKKLVPLRFELEAGADERI